LKSLVVAIAAALLSYWVGRMLLPSEPLIVVGGALFLGLILWTVAEKLWGKPTTRTDSYDIFPLLNKDVLERWGKKWGEQYEYLNKVVLYDAPLKYPIDVKYVLYFEFETSTPEGKRSEEVFNEIIAFQDDSILASGFNEVYTNIPDITFRDDWFLTIINYPGFNEKYSWVIYKK
jgi:hypothetical protein